MNRRRLLLLIGAAALLPAGIAVASPALPTPTPKPTTAPSVEVSARLNRLKTHGASEIDRRLDNLQKTFEKVTVSSQLSSGDKKTIEGQLQSETNLLIALKSRLSAETDLTAARQDVQTIIDEYKTYGLLYPRGRLMATADRMLAAGDKYTLLRANLQRKISAAKQNHKDVTKLQAALDDLRAKLADAEARYRPLAGKVLNPPTDYVTAYQALTAQRDGLKQARTDFKAAGEDTQSIIDGLKSLKDATPAPSPSASASASPAAH
jgi:DNA repair exonuclease SbcCD ATPase subunit